jgi:hypothetical protein
MGRPLKIANANTANDIDRTIRTQDPEYYDNPRSDDYPNNDSYTDGLTYGVVGGNVSLNHNQIVCRAKVGDNAEGDGFIVRQKGSKKYLVNVNGNVGPCFLVDKDNGSLDANEMTVTATDDSSVSFRLARFSNRWGIDFEGNSYIVTFNAADPDVGERAILSGITDVTISAVQVDSA